METRKDGLRVEVKHIPAGTPSYTVIVTTEANYRLSIIFQKILIVSCGVSRKAIGLSSDIFVIPRDPSTWTLYEASKSNIF